MKWASLLLVVVLCVAAVAVVSCTKPAEEDTGAVVPPPRPAPPVEEPAEEPAEEPGTEAADPMTVAKAMGVELPEGATAKTCVPTDDGIEATFEVDLPYEEVKAFYLEKQADWTNNGFEGGAMTGNDWEFTAPDEKMLVQVTSESMDPPTTIKLTLKCEPGELEGLLAAAAADDAAAEPAADDAAAEPAADDAAAEPAADEAAAEPAEEATTP